MHERGSLSLWCTCFEFSVIVLFLCYISASWDARDRINGNFFSCLLLSECPGPTISAIKNALIPLFFYRTSKVRVLADECNLKRLPLYCLTYHAALFPLLSCPSARTGCTSTIRSFPSLVVFFVPQRCDSVPAWPTTGSGGASWL